MPWNASREADRQHREAVTAARVKSKAKPSKPPKLRYKRGGIPKLSKGVTWQRWYGAYLKSRHWQRLRAAKLAAVGERCELCGVRGIVQIHHVTYERLRREELSDLQVLCRDCHNDAHGHQTALDEEFRAIVSGVT
jgi:hypothetical protein